LRGEIYDSVVRDMSRGTLEGNEPSMGHYASEMDYGKGTDALAKPASVVSEQMNTLGVAIDTLDTQLSRLISQLEPILAPDEPNVVDQDRKLDRSASGQHVYQLRNMGEEIDRLRNRITNTVNRLEI
jgi:hypothetical protein